jgi:hypothetical protein
MMSGTIFCVSDASEGNEECPQSENPKFPHDHQRYPSVVVGKEPIGQQMVRFADYEAAIGR